MTRSWGASRVAIVAVVAIVLLLVGGLVAWWALRPREPEIPDSSSRPVGSVSIGLGNRPDVPQVGSNRLFVRAETANGQPVRGLDLDAVIFMPAMGAMPYMETRPQFRERSPGLYEGEYSLVMGGSWEIELRVRQGGGEGSRAALRLTVGQEGFTWVDAQDAEVASTDTSSTGAATPSAEGIGETIVLSAQRRQEIGVTTEAILRRPLEHQRRVPGRVAFDETRFADVTSRTSGYVRELHADFTGDAVRRGETLLLVYSPDAYTAQREYVAALESRDALPPGPSRERATELAEAARRRLLLWDLPEAFVEDLGRTRRARENVPILSPVSGVVVEKTVVQGAAIAPGQALFRLAPMDPIWVVADVFSYELPLLRTGLPVRVALPMAGGPARTGRITYLFPSLSPETRTAPVRIEVDNRDLALRPEMYVDVELRIPLGQRLAVPVSAVLYTGERRVVFVDRGSGRLEAREVRLGPQAGGYFPVESGLTEGDVVVTSGNFLVAAESRLRAATRRFAP